ncbi:hypothetical protein G6F57_018328 [Rhizopus arrhizus]|uniref:Uncharacterized protein n=1 Tax=Rhizopus oryzae TaxID=64495 RepID=A0A9P6WVB2_RHIOR|nr:hypothetical protein G6F23_013336 [Rhizopus arrhizus]KAG0972189.1 hypothetical protein G6F29_013647 [Rhizopus arrhizus]KAG1000661.1 hypothetical protein G6F27_013607 [Rhizopus arrhizus]KAG1019003.1 hypothetical protein G6F25_013653 [Rhizopus arrhizus]KAG1082496.1 hypothetical protein G6F39_013627 [Rhizopus arrhizus]
MLLNCTLDNRIIKARIWDTAGQERYRPVTSCRCHNAKGVFIVYDITSRSSFENARRWLREIRKYADPNVVIMLVGNKADLSESSREVKTEEGYPNKPTRETSGYPKPIDNQRTYAVKIPSYSRFIFS